MSGNDTVVKVDHATVRFNMASVKAVSYTHLDVYKRQVVGIGNDEISRFTYPSLSSVEYYYHEMGTKAARLVLEGIERGKSPRGVWYIGYSLVRRESF